jgi:hypothetical protein
VPPQHLVGVADDARPVQLTYPVNHLTRLPPRECQVATMQHPLNAAAVEVGDNRLERDEVAVDVRDDR